MVVAPKHPLLSSPLPGLFTFCQAAHCFLGIHSLQAGRDNYRICVKGQVCMCVHKHACVCVRVCVCAHLCVGRFRVISIPHHCLAMSAARQREAGYWKNRTEGFRMGIGVKGCAR